MAPLPLTFSLLRSPSTVPARASTMRKPRIGKHIRKPFVNVEILVLCAGFIAFFVLSGTISMAGVKVPFGTKDLQQDSSSPREAYRSALSPPVSVPETSGTKDIQQDSSSPREAYRSALSAPVSVPETSGTKDLQQDSSSPREAYRSALSAPVSVPETEKEVEEAAESPTEPDKPYSLGPKLTDWDQQRQAWLAENPEFANNGKPSILLVTGSQPASCDNPVGDHFLLKSIKNKMDYCRLHGIHIFYNMAHLDIELTGFWSKLPLLRKLMLTHPEMEWLWWMDSDAMFTDMAFEVPMEKYKEHNLILDGWDEMVYNKKSWVGLNTGSFLLRNCQWSLDILDAWAPMGPKGKVREEAGKVLAEVLEGRLPFEADDQSALVYILVTQKELWGNKVFLENSYILHGYWVVIVETFEKLMESRSHQLGHGEERWPFVTHFVGCKPCGSSKEYPMERCLKHMERAFNFGDNQILQQYGFQHESLGTFKVKRTRSNDTSHPLFLDT